MILVKTPLRVSFFGGGTDFEEYTKNSTINSLLIGTAINKYNYTLFHENNKFFENKYRIVYRFIENTSDVENISINSLRNMLREYHISNFLGVYTFSDLPANSGTGSSSAFSVSIVNALNYLKYKKKLTKKKLFELSYFLENTLNNENTGFQDQIFSSYGGTNFIEISNKQKIKVHKIKNDKLNQIISENCALLYLNSKRYSNDIQENLIENIKNKKNYTYLNEIRNISYQVKELIEKNRLNVNLFSEFLNLSWKLKKMSNIKSSNSKIDNLIKRLLRFGVKGAKVIGAGGAGFILITFDKNYYKFIKNKFSNYTITKFSVSNEGSKIINV